MFSYLHLVPCAYGPSADHFRKHTFPGHDTLSHFLKYLTAVMALFPNLRYLQNYVPAAESCAHRQAAKINPCTTRFSPKAPFSTSAPRARNSSILSYERRLT